MDNKELKERLKIILELSENAKAADVMLKVLVAFTEAPEVEKLVNKIMAKFKFKKKVA